MKKFILLTIVAFFAMSCEIKMKGAKAEDNAKYGRYVFSVGYSYNLIQYNTIEIDGMEYAVFGGASSNHGVGVAVVNLTKDKLEVELLKRQLKK